MLSIVLRAPTPEDLPALMELDALATADLRKVYRPTAAATARRAALDQSLQTLIATVDDHIVGIVRYTIQDEQLSLLGLGVHPRWRRQGIAAALVRELEGLGRASACTSLALHTVRQTGNVEVFQRLGFFVDTERPADLFESVQGVELSEVAMRRVITT